MLIKALLHFSERRYNANQALKRLLKGIITPFLKASKHKQNTWTRRNTVAYRGVRLLCINLFKGGWIQCICGHF